MCDKEKEGDGRKEEIYVRRRAVSIRRRAITSIRKGSG